MSKRIEIALSILSLIVGPDLPITGSVENR